MTTPKTAGVYMVQLSGTRCVYVGESADVYRRWKQHRNRWAAPNDASFVVVREMPDSSSQDRRRTEAALSRLLRKQQYVVCSLTAQEHGSIAGRASAHAYTREMRLASYAKQTPEQRSRRTAKAREGLTSEDYRALGLVGGRASVAVYTPEQRSIAIRTYCASLSADELRARGLNGGAVSATSLKPNTGRFTSERLLGIHQSQEHRTHIRAALQRYWDGVKAT